MPKIIKLEQHVADLIAAGEVVSRPASVVKELAENSIDAGAGIVTVEIKNGGMTYIRVADNGCGIAPEDAETAFLRHATSKLRDASGLEAIETLGFRGEALAAVAAVSRIELLTRTADSENGVRLILEAGEVRDTSPVGIPVGTTIIVRDLFFNTPARMKFMKTDRAEGSAVSSAALRTALSQPGISFRYIKDGKTEFHTPGDCQVRSCIYSLLGKDIETGLVPVSGEDEYVSVRGYTSVPSASRGNRSYQFFFINGRVVRSLLLQSALEQAYGHSLMSGRFPSCVLYITTGAGSVDVNVHPAKTEVRFVSDKQVYDGVYYAVLGALEKCGKPYTAVSESSVLPSHNPLPYNAGTQSGAGKDACYKDALADSLSVAERPYYPYSYQNTNTTAASAKDDTALISPATPEALPYRLVGEVFDSYIIVEREDLVIFIDKHAAHERIHYDALAGKQYEPMSEALLTPVVCRIGHANASLLLENEAFLDTLGFTAESFGEDAVAVRHIPADIRQCDVETVLSEICNNLEHGSMPQPESLDKIYKTIACKAAIKAGNTTEPKELEALAARVMSGEIITCPHGRPVVAEFSKSMLEKRLGRS